MDKTSMRLVCLAVQHGAWIRVLRKAIMLVSSLVSIGIATGGAWADKTLVGATEMASTNRLAKPRGSAGDLFSRLFRKTGSSAIENFEAVSPVYRFDVMNTGTSYVMMTFEANACAKLSPGVVRIAPHERKTVKMVIGPEVKSFKLSYAVSQSATPFRTHTNRYRATREGETVMCVPVARELHAAMQARAESIIQKSRELVTDKAMPIGTYIYTPGPAYRAAGIFCRDFLYQLEGSGRDMVTADEVKRAVDFNALKQLTENRKVGAYTYPKGAIPDHVYPDGGHSWGPGLFRGDDTGHFNRPSMDEAMCFILLAWHYGYRADWNAAWQEWFKTKSERFVDAWNSVPRNSRTGLVTQWTTPGHLGANGIQETTGACVMWGFHDSYGFGGDDLGTSVLACNAARALADMYDHVSDLASAKKWEVAAAAMGVAIQKQFNPAGYLPWGVGPAAPTMASPDITGYAVWSGILTDAQADAAADWFAACYKADKAAGGAADMFQMTPGLRGSVRMARKANDVSPGRHVWPDMTRPHWENLAYGYNAYQDGGYWYYRSLGIATTLWRKHPAEAKEWVTNTYADITTADDNHPYERIDGVKPVNNCYNASVGPVYGMGMPAVTSSVSVSVDR